MAPVTFVKAFGILLGVWLAAGAARAETIVLVDDVARTAEYLRGEPDRPAVLILHGFLQTRYATTVSGLSDAVAGAGYTVLTPTLSLGIDHRRRSLACEAVHAHDMDGDVREIGLWVHWLRAHGHRRVILVGHSFGSLQVLAYLANEPDPAVIKAIATSLVDLEHGVGAEQIDAEVARAQELVAAGKSQVLSSFGISYCKHYVAPAAAFLSYATWSKRRILDALGALTVPYEVIMGGNDRRMDEHWPQILAAHGVQVTTIAGANHFFDGVHEMELADSVLKSLDAVAR